MELKVKKAAVGKFGPYIQDEAGKFHSTTKEVLAQITGPCVVDATEMEAENGYKKITAVTIKANTTPSMNETRLNVDAGNCLQRAVELVIAGKSADLYSAVTLTVGAYKSAMRQIAGEPEVKKVEDINQDGEYK